MKKSGLCSVLKKRFRQHNIIGLFLIAVLAGFAWGEDTDSVLQRNQQIAEVYADSAFTFLLQGNLDAALETAQEALSYYPAASDALLIQYFIQKVRKEPLDVCISSLEMALKADHFKNFYKEDVLIRYCHELITVQRLHDALRAVQAVIAEDERYYILARAHLELGNLETALYYFKLYIGIHPDAVEALIPFLMRIRKTAYSKDASAFIEYIKTILLPLVRFEHPRILPALVSFAGDWETARLYLREYRAYNARHPYASWFAWEYGLISWDTLLEELFTAGGTVPYEVYELTAQGVPTPEALQTLKNKLARWSGFVVSDNNYDGIPEAAVEFKDGLPVYAYRDLDQNGIHEATVLFKDGVPESVSFAVQNAYYTVSYYRWPLVREVIVSEQSGTLVYTFVPGAFSWKFVEKTFLGKVDTSFALWYSFPERLYPEPQHALVKAAVKIERLQGTVTASSVSTKGKSAQGTSSSETANLVSNSGSSTVWLSGSIPIFALQTAGIYKVSTLFSDGFPVYERIDIDADGKYDGIRMYIRNKSGSPVLAETRIDSDGNSVYEYTERYFPSLTKLWDTNQDGIPDIILTEEEAGTFRYEAAVDSTGTFPLVVYLKGTVPVRVLFRGQEFALIKDTNPAVYWIGEKYFDFAGKNPAPGWGTVNGQRYFVLKTGSLYFVQPFGP